MIKAIINIINSFLPKYNFFDSLPDDIKDIYNQSARDALKKDWNNVCNDFNKVYNNNLQKLKNQ